MIFCGRRKDVIIRGGENIMTEEVVNALMACSGIADACVFGEPDEFWGETVLAAVVPTVGFVLDERRLAAEQECHLAKFKRPSRFVFLKSFPLLANGKVDMVAFSFHKDSMSRFPENNGPDIRWDIRPLSLS